MDTQTIKATKEEIFPITHGTLQEINEMSQLHTNPSIIVVSHYLHEGEEDKREEKRMERLGV